ncbi:MAG: AGE family epimerase/isomerase [Lachnospiraceae bacterium]|nr:AGE family epimerase/isomerase [Lachnospiraceae bacterium]
MDKKYKFKTEENRQFLKAQRDSLFSFGKAFPSPYGSAYYLGDDGTPWKERPRETWITSRMIHVYSMAAILGTEGAGELAEAGLKGLKGELHDDKNGGWFAGVTAEGGILPTKQCYAHAFVILASTSALRAGIQGAEALLEDAVRVYDRFFWDEEAGLSVDTWDTDFKELSDYRGINANMHTVEAFLAAADALEDDTFRKRAGRIIDHVIAWAKENEWRIPEHFTKDWKADLSFNQEKPDDPFKPYGATPGHGIEWARLILQWAISTYGSSSKETESYLLAAEELYNRAAADGWHSDGADGFCYTTGWDGKPIVHDRMHWTLAEGINTAAVLYRVTEKDGYAADYAKYLEYLDRSVIDHKNGSWFHQLDKEQRVMTTVWPGKSDLYHAVQAMLIPYNEKPGISIAYAL